MISHQGRYINPLFMLLLHLIAYLAVCYTYENYLHVVWGYFGFKLNFNIDKFIIGGGLTSIISLSLPKMISKPSDFFIHVHFLIPVLPMLAVYAMRDLHTEYMLISASAFLLIVFLRNITYDIPTTKKIRLDNLTNIYLIISYLFILGLIAFGTWRYINFNIFKVYEYRRVISNFVPANYYYLGAMVTTVMLPFVLVTSIEKNNKYKIVLAILGSVLSFALLSQKSPLFYPVLVVSAFYVMKSSYTLILMLFTYITMTVLPLFYQAHDFFSLVGNLIFRRTILMPANVNFIYHEFFEYNPKVYFSNSKLTFGLLEYPYDNTIAKIIGIYSIGHDSSYNTNWIGTGYMHMGYYGMFFYALIIAFIFSTLDQAMQRFNIGLIVSIAIIPLFTMFISSDIPVSFLTHGVLLVMITLFISTKNSEQ